MALLVRKEPCLFYCGIVAISTSEHCDQVCLLLRDEQLDAKSSKFENLILVQVITLS